MPRDDKLPWFQFYPDDFSGDGKVEAMSTTGVGAYMLLLCKAWREDPIASLPNDDTILARWSRLTSEEWQSHKTEILAAFTLREDGRWYQSRLECEFIKAMNLKKKKSEAGKVGAAARWTNQQKIDDGTANATAMRQQCLSPSPSPSHSKNTGTGKACVLSLVSQEMLGSPERVLEWFKKASTGKKKILEPTDSNKINVVALAQRVIRDEEIKNPAGCFVDCIKKKNFQITNAEEDRAVAAIKLIERGPPKEQGSDLSSKAKTIEQQKRGLAELADRIGKEAKGSR